MDASVSRRYDGLSKYALLPVEGALGYGRVIDAGLPDVRRSAN